MHALRAPIVGCLLAGSAVAEATSSFQWLNKELFNRISITGRRVLGYHMHNVSGDKDAFNSLTYFGQGGKHFTDNGQMSIVGKNVLGFLNFNMQLSDSRYQDPQARKIWLDYKHEGFSVGYGDLDNVSLLNTNQFAVFSKSLHGESIGYQVGRFAVRALHSEAKSSARTATIQGNNTLGPYYLGGSQIVNDSEEVRVDGQTMRLGQDYTINYEVGSITFISRVIPPTSAIVVSFETLGFNASGGTIMGGSAAYDFGRFGRLGLTHLEQRSGGRAGLGTRTEGFWGYGSASAPYTLAAEPMPSRPIIIKLNGIPQNLGVDYVFAQLDGQPFYQIFYFLRDVPTTSRIDVTYTPKPVQALDGDRKVTGFDYRLPLGGKHGFLSYSQATGSLINDVSPMTGTARGIRAEYSLKNLKFHAAAWDIPRTFVTVETRGFNRNERAANAGVEYQRGPYSFGLSGNNSSVSLRSSASNGTVTYESARNTTARAYATYRPDRGLTWTLEQLRTATRYHGQDTRIDTTNLGLTKSFGKLNTTLGFSHQAGEGPITRSTGTTFGKLSLDTVKLTSDYSLDNGWFFGSRASLSSIRSLGKDGKGTDMALSASYRPSKGPFSFESSYTVSNSGELATLGTFINGSALGYGGNGFSSGAPNAGLFGGSGNARLLQILPTYKLGERANLVGRFYQASSAGAFNSNTETTSFGLGLDWDLGSNHALGISFDKSQTRFLGLTSRSDSINFDAFIGGSPKGPWSYRLGVTGLVSGKSTSFAQDSLGVEGALRHRLNSHQNLSFQFSFGRTTGYYPQSDNFVGLSYEYQLYRNVSLIGSYKIRSVTNLATSATSGAYKSRGFDLELSFGFGQ